MNIQMSMSLCDGVNKGLASCISYALSRLKEELVLKSEQSETLELIFQGKDVFVWFTTGYGKSVCYQALLFMFDHKLGRLNPVDRSLVIVVSPLVSLMTDQVTGLRSIGVGAAIISTGNQAGGQQLGKELLVDKRDVGRGKISDFFGAPEAIVGSERWHHLLLGEPLCWQIVAVARVYKWYLPF